MSAALEVALFFGAAALVVLAACLVPISLQALRQLEQFVLAAGQAKASLEVLLQDSRELVRKLDEIAQRANLQMDEVTGLVQIGRRWTERADRLVDEVGSAIEPPIFSLVRNVKLLRTGANVFLRTLLHPNRDHNGTRQEEFHV